MTALLPFSLSFFLFGVALSIDCDVVLSIYGSDSSSTASDCLKNPNSVDDHVVHYLCQSLEAMLKAVSTKTVNASTNCTELRLPTGQHIVRRNHSFTQNMKIVSEDDAALGSVAVSFLTDFGIISSLREFEPLFVWKFESVDIIEISGVSFVYSPGIISAVNVSSVLITNSSFEYFIEGAVDIFNCPFVQLVNCTFKHSGHNASVLKPHSYSIHSGGLSISVDTFTTSRTKLFQPYVTLSECRFYNNSAIPSSALSRSTNQIFSSQVFTGRGGGLGIALNSPDHKVYVLIENCIFEENKVLTWGGGAYIILGTQSNHTSTNKGSKYIRNKSNYGAGGFFLGTFSGGYSNQFSTSNVIDCDFLENYAENGGGSIWPVPGAAVGAGGIFNRGKYENCRFINNSAPTYGALALVTGDAYNSQISHTPVDIINCTFINNNGQNVPVFGALYVPVVLQGHNLFDRNKGGAFLLVGAIADVKGVVEVLNSEIGDTHLGAVTVTSFGQLILYQGARLIFHNNTGSVGAALVAENNHAPTVFAGIVYNPLCFLLYEDLRAPPNEWKDVEFTFSGNMAVAGSAIFTSQLRVCSWTQLKEPYFNTSGVLRWNFINYGVNTNYFHENSSNPQYYLQTLGETIQHFSQNISVYPGEEFMMSLKVLDELGNPVFSVIRIRDPSLSATDLHNSFIFNPSVHTLDKESENIRASGLIHLGFDTTYSHQVEVQSIEDANNFESSINLVHFVRFNVCPPGHILESQEQNTDFQACHCDFDDIHILTCDNWTVKFQNNIWASNDPTSRDNLFTYPCPVGYCSCQQKMESECVYIFDPEDPNNQCVSDRQGTLCGECRSDAGVSALLNKCVTCHDGYSVLIPLLVIVDVIVLAVGLRFFICHEYPSWVLPCIFYIQFLPYASESFGFGFEHFRPYLYYVASSLSFYFPYDFCLYHNMGALISYTLRFLPMIITAVITPIMIVYCWHTHKFVCNKEWHMIWILLLLNYQFTLHTSMSILNCPTISTVSGVQGHWFISGNIQCFTGGHVPLALLAILVMIALALFIPLSLLLALRQYNDPIWLKRIQTPLKFWFKENYHWWFSIELARRFLLLLMIVPFNGSSYPASVAFTVTSAVFMYVQPYNSLYANILEIGFSVSTILLYMLENQLQFQPQISNLLDNLRISPILVFGGFLYYIPLVVSMPFVAVHIWQEGKQRIKKWKQKQQNRQSKTSDLRHFSAAAEIKTSIVDIPVSNVNMSSKEDKGRKILCTVIEQNTESNRDVLYSIEALNVVIENKAECIASTSCKK